MRLKDNVARGAAKLDEIRPGWHQTINLSTLNMAYASYCIVGQLGAVQFGTLWPIAVERLFGPGFGCGTVFGVYLDPSVSCNYLRQYTQLKQLWEAEILTRRLADEKVKADAMSLKVMGDELDAIIQEFEPEQELVEV